MEGFVFFHLINKLLCSKIALEKIIK